MAGKMGNACGGYERPSCRTSCSSLLLGTRRRAHALEDLGKCLAGSDGDCGGGLSSALQVLVWAMEMGF